VEEIKVIELAINLDEVPAGLEGRAEDYRRASKAAATLRAYLRDFECVLPRPRAGPAAGGAGHP
jgi:hypothetical protein